MRKNKQKKHASFGEKLVDAAELPKDIALGFPKVTLLARKEATVENYKGIIEYDDTTLRLYTAIGILCVEGKALDIAAVTDEDITVAGDIRRIAYE